MSGIHLCRAMQVSNTPTVLVIDGRSVHKYDGEEFTFDAVKTWLDTKAYNNGDVAPLSTNIEAYVREGESKSLQESGQKHNAGGDVSQNTVAWALSSISPSFLQSMHNTTYRNLINPVFFACKLGHLSKIVKCMMMYFGVMIPFILFLFATIADPMFDLIDPAPPKPV